MINYLYLEPNEVSINTNSFVDRVEIKAIIIESPNEWTNMNWETFKFNDGNMKNATKKEITNEKGELTRIIYYDPTKITEEELDKL